MMLILKYLTSEQRRRRISIVPTSWMLVPAFRGPVQTDHHTKSYICSCRDVMQKLNDWMMGTLYLLLCRLKTYFPDEMIIFQLGERSPFILPHNWLCSVERKSPLQFLECLSGPGRTNAMFVRSRRKTIVDEKSGIGTVQGTARFFRLRFGGEIAIFDVNLHKLDPRRLVR